MNDRVERKQIGFPEFGVRFIHAAITPERLQSRIGGMIGPIPEIKTHVNDSGFGDVSASGAFVSVDVAELTPNDLQLSAVYDVRLGVNLSIVINILNVISAWKGEFTIPVQMSVSAYTPLDLEIAYRPVQDTDIKSAFEAIDLIGAFPPYKDAVQSTVHQKIAETVNAKMDAALKDRQIDVAQALAAMDAPEDPAAKPDPSTGVVKQLHPGIETPVEVLPGEKFEGTLSVGERTAMLITVNPDTVTELSLAARLTEENMYGTNMAYKLIDPDQNVLDRGTLFSVYDYQDFVTMNDTFYNADYRGPARIVLETRDNDLQIRGKLTFSKYEG